MAKLLTFLIDILLTSAYIQTIALLSTLQKGTLAITCYQCNLLNQFHRNKCVGDEDSGELQQRQNCDVCLKMYYKPRDHSSSSTVSSDRGANGEYVASGVMYADNNNNNNYNGNNGGGGTAFIGESGAHYACLKQDEMFRDLPSLDRIAETGCTTDKTTFKRILNETIQSQLKRASSTHHQQQQPSSSYGQSSSQRAAAERLTETVLRGTAYSLKRARVCVCRTDMCNDPDFDAFLNHASAHMIARPSLLLLTATAAILSFILDMNMSSLLIFSKIGHKRFSGSLFFGGSVGRVA